MLLLDIRALIAGILLLVIAFRGGWGSGVLGGVMIVFGVILLAEYGRLGSGLAILWAAAVRRVSGHFDDHPGVPAEEGLMRGTRQANDGAHRTR